MLLDANGLIYRAYFALYNTPLTTSHGELVNAVFGFWSIVLRGFQDVRPDYVIACFDLAGPTFRHEAFAEYKATRRKMPDDLRDQFPKVRELIEAFRIPIHQLEGWEADDLIGTLARQAEARGLETTIVSGDLDMLQLVSDETSVMTTRGGVQQTVVYDPTAVFDRYGLTPAQMIDFKALKGDTTDNIPGIPGVGDKTAAKLLIDFGTLDDIYADPERVVPEKLRQKVIEHRDQVLTNRELVTIHRDLPVELDLSTAGLGDYDRAEVIRLFREYEFRSLVERLPSVDGEAPLGPGELLRQEDGTSPIPAAIVPGRVLANRSRSALGVGEGSGLQLTLDFASLGDGGGVAEASQAPAPAPVTRRTVPDRAGYEWTPPPSSPQIAFGRSCAIRPWPRSSVRATTPLPGWPRSRRSTSASPSTIPGPVAARSWAWPWAAPTGASSWPVRTRHRGCWPRSRPCGHPWRAMTSSACWSPELARRDPSGSAGPVHLGAALPPIGFDTQIAAYILNAALRSQTLIDICAERLGVELPPAGTLGGRDHAAVEAAAVAAARVSLEPSLREAELAQLYGELELPLVPVLAGMEATGVALDGAALDALRTEFATEIARLEAGIYEAVGHEFNLGSPKQLEQVLFYELDLPRGKRTKTGYSTDATVLEELRPAHPMIPMLLDWRVYTKLKSTYVDALPLLLDPRTGRLHTTFHQAVAATGRLSSSDPNLQNIPIRSDLGRRIRRAFVAGDPGTTLLAADYSQIELRILAHVSGDAALKDAFARKVDIHRETAALVLHKDPADVTADERSMAKMVNFGIAYGMSDFGLSSRANIPRAEAQAFINSYFSSYSGISYYMLHIKDVARTQGYVTTLLGRRRWIPELQQRNPNLRAAGERMAINMPIQGTAADIMKIAMIRVDERLRAAGSPARVILQVHDELLLEVPRDAVEATAELVRATMEGAMPLDVPLDVDVKVGDDWEAMRPLPRAG